MIDAYERRPAGARRFRGWALRTLATLDERGEGLARDLRRHALAVGAFSVLLAVAMEALQVAATLLVGGHYGTSLSVRDAILKLPWALLVCAGVWLGIVVGRGRPVIAGLAGLVIAPLASLGARAAAEMAHSLTFAANLGPSPSPLLIAGVKGVEYACLGLAIAWLRERQWAHGSHHAAAGFLAGLIFGGGILAVTAAGQPLTPVVLVGWLVNEMLFPVGCALILFRVEGSRRSHLSGTDGAAPS
jgi:hypothetical protein